VGDTFTPLRNHPVAKLPSGKAWICRRRVRREGTRFPCGPDSHQPWSRSRRDRSTAAYVATVDDAGVAEPLEGVGGRPDVVHGYAEFGGQLRRIAVSQGVALLRARPSMLFAEIRYAISMTAPKVAIETAIVGTNIGRELQTGNAWGPPSRAGFGYA
jgi:hypothetical protein